LQLWLVVPGIAVAGPAVGEQADDGAGFRGEVAAPRGQRVEAAVAAGGVGAEQALPVEQAGEGEGTEAHAGAAGELARRGVVGRGRAEQVREVSHAYVSGFDFSTVEDSVYRRRFKSVASIPI